MPRRGSVSSSALLQVRALIALYLGIRAIRTVESRSPSPSYNAGALASR